MAPATPELESGERPAGLRLLDPGPGPGPPSPPAARTRSPTCTRTNLRRIDNMPVPRSPKLSLLGKLKHYRDLITVEPIAALFVLAVIFNSMSVQDLSLEKACRVNLRYNDTVCDALTARNSANFSYQEEQVQELTAKIAGWKSLVTSSFSVSIILFAGSWSDRHGRRKPFILLALVGSFLSTMSLILCTALTELPLESILVAEIPHAICGGLPTVFMAVNTYIADVSTEESRTLRIGILNVFFSAGIPLGSALSGILFSYVGFIGVFGFSTLLLSLNFFYTYMFMYETPKKRQDSESSCAAFLDFFQVKFLADTFRVCFRKDELNAHRRTILVLMLLCSVFISGPNCGEQVVTYLFTILCFGWNEVTYGVFQTYNMIASLIGTSITVGILSHALKCDDYVVGLVACVSGMLSSVMYACATSTWMMFVGPVLDMMSGTAMISVRSIVSKVVPSDELGKVNSVLGAAEGLMPFAFGPTYSLIYEATLHSFPGLFYLIGGILMVPCAVTFLFLYFSTSTERRQRRLSSSYQPTETTAHDQTDL